jgi:hypothetical protein
MAQVDNGALKIFASGKLDFFMPLMSFRKNGFGV